MRMRACAYCALVVASLAAAVVAGGVHVRESAERLVLGNGLIALTLDRSGGQVRLASVSDCRDASTAFADEGFLLVLDGAREVAATACRVVSAGAEKLADGEGRIAIVWRHDSLGLEARAVYSLAKGDFFARRTLAVRNATGTRALTLTQAQVERLGTKLALELGGKGQPVFVGGGVFLGLEYPAGYNLVEKGRVRLCHYPGKTLGKEFLELKSEVIGVAGRRSLEDAFAEYVRRIRVPPRSFVLYNSWYDIRRAEMSNEVFIARFDDLRKLLTDGYGVKLDSLVVDDGYQDKQSIWKTDRSIVPNDFGKLADHLRAHGSHFGLWMPLTPSSHSLDTAWGSTHGYEVTGAGDRYCVSGPRYNRALRDIIAHHVKAFGLNYYKHDFNSFACAAAGHGHLPEAACGYEANVDAYMGILRHTRKLNPDVFINVTGGMWLSPWWLTVADTVWRGGSDTGREGVVPYVERRDDSMTYVDGVLWDRFVKERRQFPPSALMTHGIIYGRRAMLGGKDEPLHRWAEHVVGYLAPGLMMKELYITPSILSDGQWAALGPALAWAEQEKDVLVETKMTHGSPHRGEVYGYRHVKGGRLLWFVRNPSMHPQTIELAIADAIGGRPAAVEITYPYRMTLATQRTMALEVPPCQTMVVEARRDKPARSLCLAGCRHAIVRRGKRQAIYDLIGIPGTKASVRLESPARIRSATLDGQPLPRVRGRRATLDVAFAGAQEACTVTDKSPDKSGNRNCVVVTVPRGVSDARLAVLCEKVGNVVPMGGFVVNGKAARPRVVHGQGWRLFYVPLGQGTTEVAWDVPLAKRPSRAFAPTTMTVSAWLLARHSLGRHRLVLTLDGDLPDVKCLPTPFAEVNPTCVNVHKPRVVRTVAPEAVGAIAKGDLAKLKAAMLRIEVFDVNGGEKYGNKPMLLNGANIGILPPNTRHHSKWQEKLVAIPKDTLSALKAINHLVLTNPTGDPYKVRGIALAVQLADGTWVETARDTTIHCSVTGGWLYFGGKPFKNKKSAPIPLALPVR